MRSTLIEYGSGDVTLMGYLADGSNGRPAPGVLVAHEATGLNERCRERANRLAALGYVAFALDLYGAIDFPLDEALRRHDELMEGTSLIHQRAVSGLNVLLGQPGVNPEKVGAVGYCQGGITVLELARGGAPIQCAIGIHPGLKRPAGSPSGRIGSKILMIIGHDDPVAPPEDRQAFIQEMEAAGADWQVHLLGGVGHTFTNPEIGALGIPGFAYDQTADARAWGLLTAMLEETIGSAR